MIFKPMILKRNLGTNRESSGKLTFEQVNEATWKLTNGEMTNVPASHGQWGGYRTSKAIAWVINVAPNAWLARSGDQTSNPSSSQCGEVGSDGDG